MTELFAIGLNPVQQRTLAFADLQFGKVNRASTLTMSVGGKGAHCARAAHTVRPGSCRAVHFAGGDSGDFVVRGLDAQGIPQLTVRIAEPTRGCTTLLTADGQMTELVEPSPTVSPAELEQLREELFPRLGTARGIALCGTFPPGVGPELYAEIARRKGRAILLLDAYREIAQTLATGAVDVLKINLDEARELTGQEDPPAAAAQCREQFGISWLALTDGPRPARLFGPDGSGWLFRLPPLSPLVNPLGAGDTNTGVTLLRLVEGKPHPEAFAWGLAAASASCQHLIGAEFTVAEMNTLFAAIAIDRI